jgi:hypothetical protein
MGSSHCYDLERERWCVVMGIDVTCGGVSVVYDDDDNCEAVLVSPDNLVRLGIVGEGNDEYEAGKSRTGSRVLDLTSLECNYISSDSSNEKQNDVDVDVYDDEDGDAPSFSSAEDGGLSICSAQVDDEEMQNRSPPPPPPFTPNPQDEYAKPRLHGLVSYLFHEKPTKQYRTGVLYSNDGELRFFNGHQEDGVPGFNSYKFYLTEKYFNKGFFRPRPDLEPGR